MTFRDVTDADFELFNSLALHPMQTIEWGEFRRKTGVTVMRRIGEENGKAVLAYQMTIHPLPLSLFTIGYVPKTEYPSEEMLQDLKEVGERAKCIYVQLEPQSTKSADTLLTRSDISLSHHPLFTQTTFFLDLTHSEKELLEAMHQKTRYNISVAEKNKVEVKEDNSEEAFLTYLRLTEETAKRQGFFAHSPLYHRLQWETLKHVRKSPQDFTTHLLLASYTPPNSHPIPLAAWIVFLFKDTLYYPYGASSELYRETMASTKMMWEVIMFGKKHQAQSLDMWGAAKKEEPDPSDPYSGFHRFKKNFGARFTQLTPSIDLIISPTLYRLFILVNTLRWRILKR